MIPEIVRTLGPAALAAVRTILAFACLTGSTDTLAFKLKPFASDTENKVRYLEAGKLTSWVDSVAKRIVDHFSSPVHEELAHRIFGCKEAPEKSCVDPLPLGRHAPRSILYGIQWNDNPPFRVTETSFKDCPAQTTIRLPNWSMCWISLFKDAESKAGEEYFDSTTGHALIYRVHFGDLQFLHAMASWDGESGRDTKTKIMAWAELTYRVSIGTLDSSVRLVDSGIEEIRSSFAQNGWTIEGLFTLGQDDGLRKEIGDVAFGSLLHMIQDSFAKGHVDRDETTVGSCGGFDGLRKAGDVREFHAYGNQNKDEHAKRDSRNFFESHLSASNPTVVDIGKALLEFRAKKAPWNVVRPYIDECVFPLPAAYERKPAGPGTGLRM